GDQPAPVAVVHPALRCRHSASESARLAARGRVVPPGHVSGHRPGTRSHSKGAPLPTGSRTCLPGWFGPAGFFCLPADFPVGTGGKSSPAGEALGGGCAHSLPAARRVGVQPRRTSGRGALDPPQHLQRASRPARRLPAPVATVSVVLTVGFSLPPSLLPHFLTSLLVFALRHPLRTPGLRPFCLAPPAPAGLTPHRRLL